LEPVVTAESGRVYAAASFGDPVKELHVYRSTD